MVGCNGRFDVKRNEICQAGCTHTRAHIQCYLIFLLTIDTTIFFLQALLSGCSAGGLATILHCDEFRGFFPQTTKVKCLSDAGLFLDVYVANCTSIHECVSIVATGFLVLQFFVNSSLELQD